MNKVKEQLKSMANMLTRLSKQVEKLSQHVDRIATEKPAKTTKVKAKVKADAAKAKAGKAAVKKKAAPKAKIGETKKAQAAAASSSVLDTVFEHITKSRKGITISKLKEKTGFQPRQVSNALYKLSKKGTVMVKTRGVYIKKV